ncbi:hypothetical protein EJB05_20031 [Eragrostis curvula]|uniref:DCD domain-containing protein n=1 Tax=Eragrostis curvula TaxID=38414 RepID=A0A5J9UX85_9POAL|nr:hypothetical protein EJB05_20031 [Eragrostis curvula]
MVKKIRRKGDSSAAPPPKAAAPGSVKPGKFKRLVKANPEKLKAAAAESAAIAEASTSASAPKSGEASAPTVSTTPNGKAIKSNRGDSSKDEKMKGREEDKGAGEDSKTSRKEMVKGREEQRRNRQENRSRTVGKQKVEEEDEEKSGAGYIFMCNARTKPECYRNGVFGLPKGKMDVVEKIRPGAKLFLYDFDLKLMYGVYKAATRGGLDLVRHAFDGKFPAQVKFSVDIDCLPIPESSFKHAIKENYSSKGRFTQELSSKQVHRLLELFKPIGLSQQPPQHSEEIHRPHIVKDRRVYDERRPSYHAEERGAPINVHTPLENHYKITPSLRPPLPNEPRHSLVLDPHQTPIGLELRHAPVALASHHVPLTRELQQVPPVYYHRVAPSSSYHQTHLDTVHERTAAEATVSVPVLSRDYGALSGDLAARTERLDELYRSYKLSTRTMDIHQDPSSMTTSYGNPRSIYSESVQRPVSTRVSGPSVPVSTRYSFAGPPSY